GSRAGIPMNWLAFTFAGGEQVATVSAVGNGFALALLLELDFLVRALEGLGQIASWLDEELVGALAVAHHEPATIPGIDVDDTRIAHGTRWRQPELGLVPMAWRGPTVRAGCCPSRTPAQQSERSRADAQLLRRWLV